MKSLHCIIILGLIMLCSSCLKDFPENFDNPESTWNPNFSFPVGYTTLQMNSESGFDPILLQDLNNNGSADWIDQFDLSFSYKMAFDLQEIDRWSEEIISIMFRLNTYNGFPSSSNVQIYFLDINSAVVDSMFASGPLTISAATIIGNGETTRKLHNQNDVVFAQNKIDDLGTVRFILVTSDLGNHSLDNTLTDFYMDYQLDMQLGVQAELNMSLSNN